MFASRKIEKCRTRGRDFVQLASVLMPDRLCKVVGKIDPCLPKLTVSYPTTIFNMQPGKEKRDALHNLVHEFRAMHGFREEVLAPRCAGYWQWVEHYGALTPPRDEAKAIRFLSSTDGYTSIRQASRMRISCSILSPEYVQILCREIRAALLWACRMEPRADEKSQRGRTSVTLRGAKMNGGARTRCR